MWTIVNQTPFAAHGTFTTDKNGADVWLVIVKATYAIQSDRSTSVAETPVPVFLEPQYRGDPRSSSLLYEADVDFPKRTTDVILNGSAYAPPGRVCTTIEVSLQVGGLRKVLAVNGDRIWVSSLLGPRLGGPAPFATLPVIYERAFGGCAGGEPPDKAAAWEVRNPVGIGFATDADGILTLPVANVEQPHAVISAWRDRPHPAGFGAIPRHWQPRASYAGTYDEQWRQQRFPLLPLDFDDRFNQCAPEDQQAASFLKGYDWVELRNLTPGGYLRFQLPYESLIFRTRIAGKVEEHRAQLYTVVLEPSHPRVLMVWVSALPCHGKKYQLERTVVLRKNRIRITGTSSSVVTHG